MFNRNSKFKMKKAMNRWLVATICLSMVLSGFAPVTQSLAVDAINSVSEMVTGDPVFEHIPGPGPSDPVHLKSYTEKIFTGENELGDLTGKQFDVSLNQIESDMENGLTPQDILQAQHLGRKYSFSADKIVQLKLQGKKDWTQTEQDLQVVMYQPGIDKYKQLYPNEYEAVRKQVFSLRDQVELLHVYHTNGAGQVAIDEMVGLFQQYPNDWESRFMKTHAIVRRTYSHSDDTLRRLQLTADETAGISESKLLQLENTAKKRKLNPVKFVRAYVDYQKAHSLVIGGEQ